MHSVRERSQLEIPNRGLKVFAPVREPVRLFPLGFVDQVFAAAG